MDEFSDFIDSLKDLSFDEACKKADAEYRGLEAWSRNRKNHRRDDTARLAKKIHASPVLVFPRRKARRLG